MPITEAHIKTMAHEAHHAAALWILTGPESVEAVTRVADGHVAGSVKIGYAPHGWSPGRTAFAWAIAALAPLAGNCTVSQPDLDKVSDCMAPMAYKYRPDHERHDDATEWEKQWEDRAFSAARELTEDTRFQRLVKAVEDALWTATTLSAEQTRHILRDADNSSGP